MASLTDLFNPTFLMFLGILVLVVALLVVYFESKLREQNHKITSLVSVISSLAEQTTNINQAIHVLTSVNNHIGGVGNIEPTVVTHLNNLVKPNNESILINVSDDDESDAESDGELEEELEEESDAESDGELEGELFYNIVEESDEDSNDGDNNVSEDDSSCDCDYDYEREKDSIIFIEKQQNVNDNAIEKNEDENNNHFEFSNNIKVLKIDNSDDFSTLEELCHNEIINNSETLQENPNVDMYDNSNNIENIEHVENIETIEHIETIENIETIEHNEDNEELIENVNESDVFNNLKTININLEDSKNESIDYKKMSLNKLRDVVFKKSLITDPSKLKKHELLKLLDSE
jgi:hypothetical protein